MEGPTDWQQEHRPPHGYDPSFVRAGDLPGDGRLPAAYGRDILTLLVRDPRCVFAFWELTETTREAVLARSAATVLRIYDLTDEVAGTARALALTQGVPASPARRAASVAALARSMSEPPAAWRAASAGRYVDYVVDGADNWYIHTDSSGLVLAAALGLGRGDAFVPLVFSNVVVTPPGGPCHETDADWLTLNELYRMLALSAIGSASAAWHATR